MFHILKTLSIIVSYLLFIIIIILIIQVLNQITLKNDFLFGINGNGGYVYVRVGD
jgi:hypothetical protein